jgi:glyoxylase-like metal-dependent hydrolase (beta-lactamase superfamily II)
MRFGEVTIEMMRAGTLRLDGGAMFGVVPRTLWEKNMAPDDRNRITLAMNVALVRARGRTILVDTGAGDKEDAKFRDQYALGPSILLEALAARGLAPEDVDVVINSHLHFDHAGGNTFREESGEVCVTFPNARYLVQRREFEDAMAAHERNRASYLHHNYKPLFDSGQMELLDGEMEIAPGVRTLPLPGHTLGLQGVFIDSAGQKALYLADCIPTRHHLPLPWIMAYDLHPMTTLETKRKLLPQAAKEGWTLLFEHDPDVSAGRLEEIKPMRYKVVPVEG